MHKKHLIERFPVKSERSLCTLVENRTAHSFDMCELSLFETHRQAENVQLTFDHFVLTSMLSGRKVMKLPERSKFDYLPGESVILPPGEMMNIDFPEAQKDKPTQCLALTISHDAISKTVEHLNEYYPKADTWGSWEMNPHIFHLTNNLELADTINRIVKITKSEHGKMKDMMIELTLKELLLRLMQTQARVVLESSHTLLSTGNSLAASIQYIKGNLSTRLDLNQISKLACMSRASFFKKFKETMGVTPAQFILKERIKLAQQELKSSRVSITEVCFASGFENLSHFVTTFKQEVGITPKAFQFKKNTTLSNLK